MRKIKLTAPSLSSPGAKPDAPHIAILRNFGGHGLDKYRAAVAALDAGGTGISNVVYLGDSHGEGQWAATNYADILANGNVGLLNAALAARWEDTGVGFQTALSLSMGATDWTYSPWVYDANWALSTGTYGIGACCMRAAHAEAVATFSFRGTGIVINATCGWTTGTAHIEIDGVAKADMVTAFAGVKSDNFTYSGLDDGAHTLTITTHDATQVMLNGAYPLNSAMRGIRMIRNCIAGIGVALFTPANALYASITQWAPVLTIIALIANDAGAGTLSAADYKTYLQTLITEAVKTGSVLLYADYPRPDKAITANDVYLKAMQEIADLNGVPMIDNITPYKGRIKTLNYLSSDGLHMNRAGHKELLFGELWNALHPERA